jgi:hypothetical protein
MKPLSSFLLFSGFLAATAFAGPITYTHAGKGSDPVQPVRTLSADCFAPGAAIGIYGSGMLDGEDAPGGGALAEYFFSDYFGLQASYGIFATDSEHHELDAALVLRYPILSLCVAPYVMAGGGLGINASTEGNVFAGAGVEARFESMEHLGIFADGAYHWADGDAPDYTIVRLGVKVPF